MSKIKPCMNNDCYNYDENSVYADNCVHFYYHNARNSNIYKCETYQSGKSKKSSWNNNEYQPTDPLQIIEPQTSGTGEVMKRHECKCKNNWISVKDRLPGDEDEDEVLVYIKGEDGPIDIAFIANGKWENCYGFLLSNVTHWQQPDPPKENIKE